MTTAADTLQADSDDEQLLAGLRSRQAHAYERMMRRYNRLVFRAARGVVHDDAEAQDVVQETWLRAFLSIDTFRGESRLSTWLVRIAIHQAISRQRRLGRSVSLGDAWGASDVGEPEDSDMPSRILNDTTDHGVPSPEEEAERLQLRRRLERAIDLLPPIYRIVFLLRAVEGQSVDETASCLRVSHDVVKTRFLRARAMLRESLQGELPAQMQAVHAFDGQRCDDIVARVLAQLRAQGVIRDH